MIKCAKAWKVFGLMLVIHSVCNDDEGHHYYYPSAQSLCLCTSFWRSYLHLSLSRLPGWFPDLSPTWTLLLGSLVLFSVSTADHHLSMPLEYQAQYIQMKLSPDFPISVNVTNLVPIPYSGNLGDLFAAPLMLPTSCSKIMEPSTYIVYLCSQCYSSSSSSFNTFLSSVKTF